MGQHSDNDINVIKDAIGNTYLNFSEKIRRENIPEIFKYFTELGKSGGCIHKLGHFAIFYTPISKLQPKLMFVGNNPSWFDNNGPRALEIIKEMECGIPSVNSYLEHNHVFARQMRKMFGEDQYRINRPDLLEGCVGMNRFWLQTGSKGTGDLAKKPRNEEFKSIKNYCERKTKDFIRYLQPKVAVMLGGPAQEMISEDFSLRMKNQGISIEKAHHPSNRNGGLSLTADEVKNIIDKYGL